MRRTYRYSQAAIAGAYARSAVGLAFTLGPLAVLEPATWLSAVLVIGAALFLVYLAKSVALHTMQIVVDANGIRTEGLFARDIAWNTLRSVELNYYTTRNDRSQGWIELVVRGRRGTIRILSVLQGFNEIVACVVREAEMRDCAFDDRTRTHLAVLGIRSAGESYDVQSLTGAHHA